MAGYECTEDVPPDETTAGICQRQNPGVSAAVKSIASKNQLLQKRQYLTDLEEELERQMQEFLQKKRHQLEMYAAKLDGCSPLKKLQGSYAF